MQIQPVSAQQQQGEVLSKIKPSPQQIKDLKSYLGTRESGSSLNRFSPDYDPIAAAMARHPDLTEDQAERIAEAFGF